MKSVFLRTALVVALAFMLWPIGIARGAETTPQWVYFRDKGTATVNLVKALDQAEEELSPRCRARREKSMSVLADEFDLPVHREYVQSVRQTGAKVRTVSKWLNAVSIEATANQIEAIEHLSFVGRVEPFRLRRTDRFEPSPCPASRLDDPDYGPSFRQNEICRIPELHARGLSGRGVLICFLDTGFLLTHRAFDSLNVAATRDFIFGDSVVHDEVGQDSAGQHGHGTVVLSAAAGYRDGSLIGPAYSADVLLAKTEWTASETAVEEDYFVAALEWADSLGTDIVSSSLGYHDWYTFEDMDGQTAVTTQAVNVAVSRGILVVTAAGNSRDNDWGHIIAPADADSILATGAVDTMLAITWFSSPGPTADGRIKPDVCALGEYVYSADPATTDGYFWVGGTSLSTPLVAGIAALILEAHPNWTAQQVRTAMMSTASRASDPDNNFGWGIVDGVAAADYVFDSVTNGEPPAVPAALALRSYPNPVNGRVTLSLTVPHAITGRIEIYDLLGRRVFAWPENEWPAGEQHLTLNVSTLPSGAYVARFASFHASAVTRIAIVK